MTFEDWTGGRSVASLGTNAGADELPFQHWRHFKEAFAPELIDQAIAKSCIPVMRCLDPFGGSGTTALACQFLGVHPITAEVNPFLADLIEAKLTRYSADDLTRDFGAVVRSAKRRRPSQNDFDALPPTFVEPGIKERWIFDIQVAHRIAAYMRSINSLENEAHKRLFRVLLGGVLVDVSNVVVSGKGRRYRRGWEKRRRQPEEVDAEFCQAARRAIVEIHRYARRACSTYELRRGDCRQTLAAPALCELAVFSPPYPNSFDYTDVYNVELWTLGYLSSSQSNQALRTATLCSHVQVSRNFAQAPSGSPKLDRTMKRLAARRDDLWDHRIPDMVGGYFHDLMDVIGHVRRSLVKNGAAWMVVGDSRYADVPIDVATILSELAVAVGWKIRLSKPCRSMRSSPQQGGRAELDETLIVLGND